MVVIACCLWMLSVAGSSPQVPSKPVSSPPVANSQPVPVDVNNLYIVVEAKRYPVPDPNGTKFTSELENVVQARLEKVKIHAQGLTDAQRTAMRQVLARKMSVDPNSLQWRPADRPTLQIALNVLFMDTGSHAVVFVQTSLTQPIRLLDARGGQAFKATIWSAEPVMESVLATQWSDDARKLVLRQVDSFIAAPRLASSASIEVQVPADSYVAFKTSSIFHRPDCPVARTISPENLVIYKTREEALAAGKQPCKSCNP